MAKGIKKNKEEYNKARREWYQKNKIKEAARLRISNARYRKKIKKLVTDYKAKRGCCRCRENDPVCLDFHHHIGKKENNIGTILGHWSEERIFKEIEKCEVLCANCHRKLHFSPYSIIE